MGKATGRRVLVVEDEAVIAMYLEDIITDLGYVFVGPAHDVSSALAEIDRGGFDCALVDLTLGADSAEPVGRALKALEIPFAFSTGAARLEGAGFADVPLLLKPFDSTQLEGVLLQLAGESGPAS